MAGSAGPAIPGSTGCGAGRSSNSSASSGAVVATDARAERSPYSSTSSRPASRCASSAFIAASRSAVPIRIGGRSFVMLRECHRGLEVLHLNGLDVLVEGETEHLRVERELRVQCPAEVLGPAEAVLLAVEEQVGDRYALRPECRDDRLRLGGRHDRVLGSL